MSSYGAKKSAQIEDPANARDYIRDNVAPQLGGLHALDRLNHALKDYHGLRGKKGYDAALERDISYVATNAGTALTPRAAEGLYMDLAELLEKSAANIESGKLLKPIRMLRARGARKNVATEYGIHTILILAGALGMIAFTATNVTGAVIGAPISDFNVIAASIFALVAVVGVLFSLRR